MPAIVKFRFLAALVLAAAGPLLSAHAEAAGVHAKNGSVILRMCSSADKVKTLAVMCNSYLDGYIDATRHYGQGKSDFCLADDDRRKAPLALTEWIGAHPESLTQPASEVLHRALAERFPCGGKK
jgi:hypothetical protein